MLSSAEEIISFLFTSAVTALDIPAELAELAVLKYEEVGNWLVGQPVRPEIMEVIVQWSWPDQKLVVACR